MCEQYFRWRIAPSVIVLYEIVSIMSNIFCKVENVAFICCAAGSRHDKVPLGYGTQEIKTLYISHSPGDKPLHAISTLLDAMLKNQD